MNPRSRALAFASALAVGASAEAFGQTDSVLFPVAGIYPVYVADPLRPTFSVQYQHYPASTIADTGSPRFNLKLGGNLALYETRLFDQMWQLVLHVGFRGLFDITQSQDNVGWDGIYGFHIATRVSEQLAWRVAAKHTSAHIGDELIERTGRRRIGYTREEMRAGLSWSPQPTVTLYAEAGRAYDRSNKTLQQRWAAQSGAQYESREPIWGKEFHWYGAVDLSSFEESNWGVNATLQVGLTTKHAERSWRLGLEFYDGRSQMGEFFRDNERYVGLGLWLDL